MAEGTVTTFTQSPASVQFSVLYGRVQNYVLSPSDADVAVVAKEGINEAIRKLNTRTWGWSRVMTDLTFASGENGREYALPQNFKASRSLELLDSANRIAGRLTFMDPKTFDLQVADRSMNIEPTFYTIFNVFDNGHLTLDSAPSTGWVTRYPKGRVRYYRRVPVLSQDQDLFVGPSEAESFIVWHGRAVAASHWAPEKLSFADRQAREWWQLLVRDDVKNENMDF